MKNIARWFSNLSIINKVQHIFAVSMAVTILLCSLFFVSVTRLKLTRTYAEKNDDKINSVQKSYSAVIDNVNNISKLIMVNDSVNTYLHDDPDSGVRRISDDMVRSELFRILNSFSGRYNVFILKKCKVTYKPPRTNAEPEKKPEKLDAVFYANTAIGIMKPDGDYLFSEKWYGRVREKKGGYTVFPDNRDAFSSNTNIETVSFTRVINDIDTQKPLGLLVINIPVSELEGTYENFMGDDSVFAYCTSDGTVINSNADTETVSELLKHNKKLTVLDHYNTVSRDRVISGRSISDTGFYIICSSRISFFDDISPEMVVQVIGLLVLIVFMLYVISKYINKFITIPVTRLSKTMTEAKQESPVMPVDRLIIPNSNDEISNLQKCYNEMADRINNLVDEVVDQEKQRRRAELIAVQEQMKPHFLYNTLDTIGCMAFQNTPEEVYDAIETLGVFYRKFLSKGSETISIEDEVTIVQKYIKLLKLRNDTEFNDEYFIEEGLGSVKIIKLILQPLVENSIQHGIIPKGEPGIIRISIYSENNRIHIKVYDSGVGMNEDQINSLLSGDDKTSFGFKGTVARIKNFYQNNAFVTINSTEGEFCEIDINIPYHR